MQEQHWFPFNVIWQRLLFLLVILSVVPGYQELSWNLRKLPCEISISNQSEIFICSYRKLHNVPHGISSNATQLDLSFNKINTLYNGSFLTLQNLTLLDVKFNGIRHKHGMKIDPLAFSHLTQLDTLFLDGNYLTTVPQGLPSGLSSLSLNQNQIENISSESFSDIPNIRSISLNENCNYGSSCKGPLKIKNETFSNLTDLANLSLSYNRIEEIPPFLPSSLVVLSLKLNTISHIYPHNLNYLVNLQVLDLSGNCPVCSTAPFHCISCETPSGEIQIHPDAFRTLSQLKELRLSGNSLRSIHTSWFQNLTSLQYLYLSFNFLMNEMIAGEFFSVLPLVEVMDLSFNRNSSYYGNLELSRHFSRMSSLQTLHMENCGFFTLGEKTLEPLYKLSNLSVINLSTNSLQNVKMSLFDRFNNLSIIDMSENILTFLSSCASNDHTGQHYGPFIHTDELYRRIPPSIKPECRAYGQVLDLSRNSIITFHPKDLQGLENITCLNLSSNSLRAFNGTEFVQFPRLKYLDLANNKINLRSDMAFSELKELEVLDLSHNSHYFVMADLIHSLVFLKHLSHLKTLNLAWNEISNLKNKTMSNKSLQKLIFQGNRLDLMWNRDKEYFKLFQGLTNLTFLDLSMNELGHIPSEVYNYFPDTLTYLDLSKNTMKSFKWNSLNRLPQLQTLDLSKNDLDFVASDLSNVTRSLKLLNLARNRISVLNPGFLKGADSLLFLDLSYNLIGLINRTTFESGSENHLKKLSIEGNPFHCNCELLDFHLWMKNNDVELPLLATAAMCDIPGEKRGDSVLSYNIEACIQDEALAFFIVTSVLILLILLVSITVHLFYWDLSYMLEFCSAKLRYPHSHTTGFKYDAFIMYDTADPLVSAWVLNCLRVQLEHQGDRILPLCLEERDWALGLPIMDNLSNSVRGSRKTVFVLTGGLLSRGVARVAAMMVQQRLVEEGLDVMVLLLLDPTTLRRSRILHLRKQLCGHSVLEWPGVATCPSAQQLFWHRLRRSIQADQNGTHSSLYSIYFTDY